MATFSLSPDALSFASASPAGPRPPSQTIVGTVTGAVSGDLFINIATSGALVSIPGVSVDPDTNSGRAEVIPALPSSLGGPGIYRDTITVRACTTDSSCGGVQLSGSPQTVAVTYTVDGLVSSPTALSYLIGDAPAAGDLSKTVSLTGFPSNLAYTSSANVPWLTFATNGNLTNGSAQLVVALDSAQLEDMVNDTYSAVITIVPAGSTAITIPVTLQVNRKEVSYVAPYVATAGVAGDVIIRGDNFDPVISSVTFGTTNALTFNRVSKTEIRARAPSLPVGQYPVRVSGVARSRATLAVVAPPNFVATTLAYPADYNVFDGSGNDIDGYVPLAVRYDAERQALFVMIRNRPTSDKNEFLRFKFMSGTWSAPERVAVVNLFDIALATDGTELLAAIAGPGVSIRKYDPVSLAAGETTTEQLTQNNPSTSRFVVPFLAFANDGTAVIAGGGLSRCEFLIRYRARTPKFSLFTAPGDPPLETCSSSVSGSEDGSLIIAGPGPTQDSYRFVASTGSLTAISPPINLFLDVPLSIDRHASRVLVNRTLVYDASFTLLGTLMPFDQTDATILSPDGTKAYLIDRFNQLRTFDLTAVPIGGMFPEIGSPIDLMSRPNNVSGGNKSSLAISPDGRTLFIAGDSKVLVQPTPRQ